MRKFWKLSTRRHDPYKVYAAYHAAVNHKDQPRSFWPRPSKVMAPAQARAMNTAGTTEKKVDIR